MSDLFISHVEEDGTVALEIARALNCEGYTTWCYEKDNDLGVSYLKQIGDEIERCQAVVLLISRQSLRSEQVTREVEFSHELQKPFVPLLYGMSHVEFQSQRVSWRVALGTVSTTPILSDGIAPIIPRVLRGLQTLGVQPSGTEESARAKADRVTREQAEREQREREKAEADRVAREEAARLAREKTEAERLTRERAEAERLANEKAEKERLAREKAEAERKFKEHIALGVALYDHGDWDGAIREYRNALLNKSDDAETRNKLGKALQAKQDWDGAIDEYREAVRLEPGNAEAHDSLGSALYAKENLEGAVAEYGTALRVRPHLYLDVRTAVNEIVWRLDRRISKYDGWTMFLALVVIPASTFFGLWRGLGFRWWAAAIWSAVALFVSGVTSIALQASVLVRRWGVRPFQTRFPEGCAELPIAISILLSLKADDGSSTAMLQEAAKKLRLTPKLNREVRISVNRLLSHMDRRANITVTVIVCTGLVTAWYAHSWLSHILKLNWWFSVLLSLMAYIFWLIVGF